MQTRIEGFIKTITPVHQTRPVKGYFDPRNPKHVSFSDKGKGQCQVMMSSSFIGRDNRRIDLPIISGNSLRGVLRRSCAKVLLDTVNQPIRTELFQCLVAGAAARDSIGGGLTALLLLKARANVFAGVFGGGASMLSSCYSVADMTPVHQAISHLVSPWIVDAAPAMPSSFGDGRTETPLTEIYLTVRRDPFLDGEGVSYVYEHDQSFITYQSKILDAARRKEAAAAAGEDNNEAGGGLRMMSYVEALVPGVPLCFSLTMKPYTTEAQMGLMLLGLQQWANAQAIGGAARRGFGRFRPTLRFYQDSLDAPVSLLQPIGDGTIDSYALNQSVQPYIDAAREAMAKVTVAELEDLFIGADKPAGNRGKVAVAKLVA